MKKAFFLPAVFSFCCFMSCNDGDDTTTVETDTTTITTLPPDTVTAPTTPVVTGEPLKGADSTFVLEAASGGMMEVELGRIAQQNAQNDRVKQFAQMMINDHSAANDELRSFAAGRNFMLPDSMMKKHRMHVESMQKVTGKNFDRQYIQFMVKDHTEDVRKFEKASKEGVDSMLKNWAAQKVPVLKVHKDSAQAISKSKL